MTYLPLDRLTELATSPIFSCTEWIEVPTSYDLSNRGSITADLFCENDIHCRVRKHKRRKRGKGRTI